MSQYLGDISAYALAVSQGYTGTEEEYAELMASYATVGQTAVTAAQTATTKASEAATSATSAASSASTASAAATTATTKASEASTSATNAAGSASSAASSATAASGSATSAAASATTASGKASEATTAATTATTAKTDAVAAKTAAQTAQTAAEMAQGLAEDAQAAAEDAAQSVSASAAQIATNTSDISDLKENLTQFTGDAELTVNTQGYISTSGNTVDVSNVTSGAFVHAVIDCTSGDTFTILQGSGGESPRLWCFIDSQGNNLMKSGGSLTVESEYRIIAPENSAKIVFNCKTSHAIKIYKGVFLKNQVAESVDILSAVRSDLFKQNTVNIPLSWEQGGINTSTGAETTDYLTALRTDFFDISVKGFTVKPNTGFTAVVSYYDSGKNYIGRTAALNTETFINNDYAFYRIAITNITRPGAYVYLTDIPTMGEFICAQPLKETSDYLNQCVKCSAGESTTGYVYYANGSIQEHESYCYVALDVTYGMTVVFKTVTNDNAGICFYDADGAFISGVKSTTNTQYITVPNNAVKCKATIRKATALKDVVLVIDPQWISNEFRKVPENYKYNDNIGNYADPVITLDTSEFVNGYVANDGTVVADNSYRLSPIIPVYEGCYITFTKVTTASWTICSWYNANSEYVGRCPNPHNANETLDSYTVQVPYGIKYMRYVCAPVHLSITNVEYVESTIPHDYKISNLVNGWYNQAFGENTKLFAKATAQPLITIIDDDTGNSETVGKFYNACKAQGIIGNFAVITSRYLNNDHTLEQTLLDYESEGFGILTHCTLQDSKWANHEYDLIREDITACLRQLRESGFINYMYWAYPGGIDNAEMQQIAKEYGFKCAISSGLNSIESTQYHSGGKYRLKRCSLDPVDGEGHLTVARFKELIDEAVSVGGWLIITTHFWQDDWTPEVISSRFDEIVDYAQAKGMKFTTMSEAWEIRKPIYDYYDMH